MSNPIYFISGFFSGKIINQLHLHLKWLLQGELVRRQKFIPVAPPRLQGRSRGVYEFNLRTGVPQPPVTQRLPQTGFWERLSQAIEAVSVRDKAKCLAAEVRDAERPRGGG